MPDLDLLRRDLGAFATEVGLPLEPWQARSLTLEARTTAVVAPRQSGKSRSLAVLAVWWAYRRRGQRVLVVSAGEEGAKRLLAEVRALVTGSPLLAGSVTDEQQQLVELSNGSEVRSVPASERQVRGWAVDLLLVDEAGLVPDDLLLGAALPTTAARPDARVVMAGSANVASGAFYDHVVRGDAGTEHVRTHRWRLTDCWWISPSAIAAARDSMTPSRFAAEYEGEFSSQADALFTRAALDRATVDYLPWSLAELRGPARMLAGTDWGATVDRSAVVALGRLAVLGEPVFAVACAHAWRAGTPLDAVIGELAATPAAFAQISTERNGMGEPCSQALARAWRKRPAEQGGARAPSRYMLLEEGGGAPDFEEQLQRHAQAQRAAFNRARMGHAEPFHTRIVGVQTTAALKAATYSRLRMLVDAGRLVFPAAAEDLRRELLLLRVELTPTGTERIEASSGHDDLPDALMLAAGPYQDRDRRWRSVLGDLAEPDARLPAITSHEPPECAPVALPDGREVPRRPVWQSVRGPETTGAPVDPSRPPADTRRLVAAAVKSFENNNPRRHVA